MNREDLMLLLQDHSAVADAARAALVLGAGFVVWDRSLSARRLWAVWKGRVDVVTEAGGQLDFVTALPRLEQAGEEPVRLGRITTSDRTYLVFLDLAGSRCVACL
ncbi:hypothetical protein AB0I39_27230 [Kitasatospora purpeofusca]|uniref:hypothetical protein n=1 Tax=Kitasatospora purpeofusca TaxID=67352 RepID=UPI0033C42956